MADEKKPGFFKRIASRITRFFKDTKGEMKKVIWPSKKAVINNTGVVMLVLVAFSICIGALDFVFNALVGLFH
ncbi:MAG: preprotein translocase subunit SecE [Negativibacillus sp.]|nr:preprotein translocase subunit SecE [Negativibacillus sp.]